MLCCLRWRGISASRVRNGYTFGDCRALAGTGDVWRRIATHPNQATKCALRKISCIRAPAVAFLGETVTPSLERGGRRLKRMRPPAQSRLNKRSPAVRCRVSRSAVFGDRLGTRAAVEPEGRSAYLLDCEGALHARGCVTWDGTHVEKLAGVERDGELRVLSR